MLSIPLHLDDSLSQHFEFSRKKHPMPRQSYGALKNFTCKALFRAQMVLSLSHLKLFWLGEISVIALKSCSFSCRLMAVHGGSGRFMAKHQFF